MAPVTAPSNIRAFVHWREPAVYAGEDIECIITFQNIATPPGQREDEELRASLGNGLTRSGRVSNAPSAAGSRRTSVTQVKSPLSRTPSMTSTRTGPTKRGHRPTLSLNVVSTPSRNGGGGHHSAPLQAKTPTSAVRPNRGHGRSLSIMSLGSEAPSEGRTPTANSAGKRPSKGHARSISLQYPAKSPPSQNGNTGSQVPRQPSPLYESTSPPGLPDGSSEPHALRPGRRRPGPTSNSNAQQLRSQRSPSAGALRADFNFPAQPPEDSNTLSPADAPKPTRSPSTMHSGQQHRGISPRPSDSWSGAPSNLNPMTRIMSNSSAAGTPRTSSEFYSMSNHSNETLMSELPQHAVPGGRLLPKPALSRSVSRRGEPPVPAQPETLMMGYARAVGYFTLDGSLVNAAPFEEVKRKGVQGGGGVIGVERSKRTSGMFGAFSWGNIGESIGGLLGNDEMSSMAQMKASAGSKAVPLLSTPQSLLFVDLRLAPGESRGYKYKFALPRGLPPSHRGRAIKVNYHLAVGVQRPGGQAVKNVEIPFRVLGSYNGRGDPLGHDLMAPYILLRDAAHTSSIAQDTSSSPVTPQFEQKDKQALSKSPKQGMEDFLRYTERLLEQPDDGSGALLSPTLSNSPTASRQQSFSDQPMDSIKEAIDFAILRSNYVKPTAKSGSSGTQSTNRFNIARSGQPVSVLTLLRPAYKLGDTVVGAIDFTASSLSSKLPSLAQTYSVVAELESSERIDSSLALRSSHSIHRVTRKVHAAIHENTAFARQITFNLTIPYNATPTFETTGVSVVWMLRVEFTTQRQQVKESVDDQGEADGNNAEELLEELGSDERGSTLIAREHLMAETFEISVPLKVYGAPGIEGMNTEREALQV